MDKALLATGGSSFIKGAESQSLSCNGGQGFFLFPFFLSFTVAKQMPNRGTGVEMGWLGIFGETQQEKLMQVGASIIITKF